MINSRFKHHNSEITIVTVRVASGEVPLLARTVNVYVPVEVGLPLKTPALLKLNPGGSVPEARVKVMVGLPVAVNVNEYDANNRPFGGAALVMVGARLLITIVKVCVALGDEPLLAVTVAVYVPFVVGVPLKTPALLKVKPGGSVPDVRENVMVGVPLAVKVWL